jgi:membrane protein implicated in regulation of membrane protease activity
MVNPGDARRRWFGSLFLILAIGMLIWGQTVLKPRLEGLVFIAYWLACIAFTGLAVLIAMLDLLIVRQRGRKEQRELLDRAWKKVPSDQEGPE